jgi:prepilin-type N-terminal cleavage/methylation domain-containing protein
MLFPHLKRQGFSLVEVLMVITIVALLMLLATPFYAALREKATLAGCLSNMRIIGLALNGYMQDHNMSWPQMPQSLAKDNKQRSRWWADTLKPYGTTQRNWICPGDVSSKNTTLEGTDFVSSYSVIMFDEYPNTAFRWRMPWAVERMGAHGKNRGGNTLMPDGTVAEGDAIPTN